MVSHVSSGLTAHFQDTQWVLAANTEDVTQLGCQEGSKWGGEENEGGIDREMEGGHKVGRGRIYWM